MLAPRIYKYNPPSPRAVESCNSNSSKCVAMMDVRALGHNIGMVVADRVNETGFLNTLRVLSTHTSEWRAGIHGVLWGYMHRSHSNASTDEQWAFIRSEKVGWISTTPPHQTPPFHPSTPPQRIATVIAHPTTHRPR